MQNKQGRYVPAENTFEYMTDIFGAGNRSDTQNVNVMAGGKFGSRALRLLVSEEDFARFFGDYSENDTFFTPNTYVPGKREVTVGDKTISVYSNAKKDAMYCVYAWGIDIDYKSSFEKNGETAPFSDPGAFYDYLMLSVGDSIPAPNWIETGHQLRLVYILSEPLYMRTSNPSASAKLLRGLELVQKRLCAIINDALECGAEPQKAWYRLPGSYNTKNGQRTLVSVEKIGHSFQYSVQDLMGEYLPDLERKEKAFAKKKHVFSTHKSEYTLNENRLEDYRKLTSLPGIQREKLLFLYGNAWKQINNNCTKETILSELFAVNRMFQIPLRENEIRSKLGSLAGHQYKFSNDTIMEMLDIDETLCKEMELHLGKSRKQEEKKRKEERRLLRESSLQRRNSLAKEMYLGGESCSDIARVLGISISAVRGIVRPVRRAMSTEERVCLNKARRFVRSEKKRSARILSAKRAAFRKLMHKVQDGIHDIVEGIAGRIIAPLRASNGYVGIWPAPTGYMIS